MTTTRRPRVPTALTTPLTLSLAATLATTLAVAGAAASPAAAAADAPAVAPVLLPVTAPRAVAVDLSPLGIVAGTSGPATDDGDPVNPLQDGTVAQRWIPLGGRYARQPLPLPAGGTGATVAGVSDAGEVAGTVGAGEGGVQRPYRWSVTGLRSTALGDGTVSRTAAAVSPAGQVAIDTPAAFPLSGTVDIAQRDGTLTPVTGLTGRGAFGYSLAGPDQVLVSVVNGIGQGTTSQPTVWQAGASKALPVFASFFFGSACASAMLADGSVAYSGLGRNPDGTFGEFTAIHRGGVPGTETNLPLPAGRLASLGCALGRDVLATDGTTAGQLRTDAAGSVPEAIVWTGDGFVLPGLRAGEASSVAGAVARGGRAVLSVTGTDGTVRFYLWRDGVRTPLRVPAGWRVSNVVETNDRGDVLANLVAADGVTFRPAVWHTGA
jgi:hypothetical protein